MAQQKEGIRGRAQAGAYPAARRDAPSGCRRRGQEGLIRPMGGLKEGRHAAQRGWTSQGGTAGARTHEGAATDMVTAPCVLKKKSPGVGLLSHELPRSIIGDGGLNFRVRNGIGCTPSSMDARTDSLVTVREGWLCSRRHFVRDRNRIK